MSIYTIAGLVLGYIFMAGVTARMFKGKGTSRAVVFSGLLWPLTWVLMIISSFVYLAVAAVKGEWPQLTNRRW